MKPRWASWSQAIREGKRNEKLVADLYQAADGNPLFVDGMGRLLVAKGSIDRAVVGDAFKIPDGVPGVDSAPAREATGGDQTAVIDSLGPRNQVETQLLGKCWGLGRTRLSSGWGHGLGGY